VAPGYAPDGKSLISVSVIGNQEDNTDLTRAIEAELVEWFGEKAETWKHLRTEHIRQALPVDPLGNETEICRHESIWICGDHTRSGSIEGAIISGLETANCIYKKE
jgi:predicted NAD/FAD-dependent oxidoreductase